MIRAIPVALAMTKRDEFFRERLLRDYDRLIFEIETTSATKGDTFCMFVTPMDGRLIAAALRTARDKAQSEQPDLADYDPTSFGDQVAAQVRSWYEQNRESWSDRFWKPWRTSADGFMLRFVRQVAKAERDLTVEIRTTRAASAV